MPDFPGRMLLFPTLIPRYQTTRHNITENVQCRQNFTSSVSVSHCGIDDLRTVVPFMAEEILASSLQNPDRVWGTPRVPAVSVASTYN